MKSLIKSFVCPACGKPFPFFIGPSKWVRRGFFSAPLLRCPTCSAISRQKISWADASWAWPLTIVILAVFILILRNSIFFISLRHSYVVIYAAIAGGAVGFIGGAGFRRGLRLAPVFREDATVSKPRKPSKWTVPILVAIFLLVFGFLTGRWVTVVIALSAAIVVRGLLYSFSKRETY